MYLNLLNYVYVAIGGALGAVSRYIVSTWVYSRNSSVFPYGTFTVNILGSFILGFIYTLTLDKSVMSPQLRMMVTVGFLGAFTTFSTFSLETLNIIKDKNYGIAILNIGVSIILGLIAVWLGMLSANFINRFK